MATTAMTPSRSAQNALSFRAVDLNRHMESQRQCDTIGNKDMITAMTALFRRRVTEMQSDK